MHVEVPLDAHGNVVLLLTQFEYGFQEVLDSFPSASKIFVTTYSLAISETAVIYEKLKTRRSDECEVNIVSNVPRDVNEPTKMELYRGLLDPNSYGPNFSSFFNVENHSKIIATDQIAYVGSANFSTYTKNQIECGVLIKDGGLAKQVLETFSNMLLNVDSTKPHPVTERSINAAYYALLLYECKNRLRVAFEEAYDYYEHDDIAGPADDLFHTYLIDSFDDTCVFIKNELEAIQNDPDQNLTGGDADKIVDLLEDTTDLLQEIYGAFGSRDEYLSAKKVIGGSYENPESMSSLTNPEEISVLQVLHKIPSLFGYYETIAQELNKFTLSDFPS